MCFCGKTDHEAATCRHCGAAIVAHREPGLFGWFARYGRRGTFANGDCPRDAMSAMHAPVACSRDDDPTQHDRPSWVARALAGTLPAKVLA